MRWPFVARLAYEAAVSRAERAEQRLDTLAERHEALVGQLLTMKREGYQPQPAPVADLPPDEGLPLPVAEALDGLGLGPADHAREAARLKTMLDAGSTSTDVIRNLYEGFTHG